LCTDPAHGIHPEGLSYFGEDLYKAIVFRWLEKPGRPEGSEQGKSPLLRKTTPEFREFQDPLEEEEISFEEGLSYEASTPQFFSSEDKREAGFCRMREFFYDLMEYDLPKQGLRKDDFWRNIEKGQVEGKIIQRKGAYVRSLPLLWERSI
jgi:hypothetical protein